MGSRASRRIWGSPRISLRRRFCARWARVSIDSRSSSICGSTRPASGSGSRRSSTSMAEPTIAELRAATQPASIFARDSGEHWAGRLYVRRASPYLTRMLLRTRISPNGVTWLMIIAGLAAAAVLSVPGVATAVAAVALIQLQILLDCSDGELARWQQRFSPTGIYLDRLGHWLTQAALPIALGVRADGGWDELGTYTALGLLVAVLVLLVKGESALVTVARAEAGLAVAH